MERFLAGLGVQTSSCGGGGGGGGGSCVGALLGSYVWYDLLQCMYLALYMCVYIYVRLYLYIYIYRYTPMHMWSYCVSTETIWDFPTV